MIRLAAWAWRFSRDPLTAVLGDYDTLRTATVAVWTDLYGDTL